MNHSGARSPRFVVTNTAFLLLSFWAAAVAFWPIYQDPAVIRLILVATVIGSVIAIFGARFRWSLLTMVAATVGTFLVIGVPLAVPGEAIGGVFPSFEGFRQLAIGVALGWKQLLTVTLPVATYQALLVPPLVLILGLSVICLSLALRSRFGGIGASGALIVLIAGIALGPETESWPVPNALAVIAITLLWLGWRRQFFRAEAMAGLAAERVLAAPGGFRTLVAGTVVLAIAGGVGTGAIALLPTSPEHQVLRTAIEPPFDALSYVSPLAGFRQYLQPPMAQDVLLTVDGLVPGDRIRLATLDSYDGVVYSVGSASDQTVAESFTRVPYQFDQSGIRGTVANISVRIAAYAGVWLPTLGQLESVRFSGERNVALQDSFFYNNGSGTGAVVQQLGAGDSYRLQALRIPQPTVAATAQLTPGGQTISPAVVPAELDRALARYTAGSTTAGERLSSMIAGLRAEGYISHGISATEPASRSGHSAERITQLLTDQPMVGDAEQYATAAAIMAQQLGFPARVVVGFEPAITAGIPVDVRGEAVSAWIEVGTARYGWVALDVLPDVRPIPERAPDEPQAVSRPQPVIPPPAESPNNTAETTPLQNTQEKQPSADGWFALLSTIATVAVSILLALVALALPLVAVILVKGRRTRFRRRARTARERMVGGWQEFADNVIDHRMLPPHAGTRREFAQLVGGAKAAVLAAVVDAAVFSPNEPAPGDDDKVWRAVNELGKELRVGLTRRERVRAAISLRSLTRVSPKKARKNRGAAS